MVYYFVACILNAFLMAGLSLLLIDYAAPWLVQEGGTFNTLLRWGMLVGMTIVGTKWLNNISLVVINMIVYGGDMEGAAREAMENTPEVGTLPENFAQVPKQPELVNFIIVNKPEAPYAKYQDADIFEWLEVEDELGAVRRMEFEGTVDMKKGIPANIEPGTLLLPPGILYKFTPAQ